MHDILLKIQDAFLAMDSLNVGSVAATVALLGLIMWLGGSRYGGIVVAILGAVVGAFGGLFLGHWFDWSLSHSVPIGAILVTVIAVLMRDVVIVVLAASIFAVICGTTYLSYSVNSQDWHQKLAEIRAKALKAHPITESSEIGSSADLRYLQFLQEQSRRPGGAPGQVPTQKLREVWAEMRYAADSNYSMLILWTIVGAGVGLMIAYFLKKVIMALCCSMVGATMVFCSSCAMLLAKKAPVISQLMERQKFVLTMLVGMIIFGFLIQLLFRVKPHKEQSEEKEIKK